MKVFMIGGTGLLGSEAAKVLISRGHEVTALALPDLPEGAVLPPEMKIRYGNYLEMSDEEIRACLTGCDGFVFAAGVDERVEGPAPIYDLYKKYNIDPEFWKTKDIHIHAPEGAVPKDGPSAGVTLTTALVSALSGTPVRRDVAMTGEITLRGKVLAIGGLKEKTMAAYRAGVKTVCIPKENEPDIDELDDVVKNSLKFVVAEDISTVLETALVIPNCNPKEKAPLKRRTTAKAKAEKKLPALTAN